MQENWGSPGFHVVGPDRDYCGGIPYTPPPRYQGVSLASTITTPVIWGCGVQ
ncbi:hypothetical protein BH23GEM2_BH23GEM2_15360 [soil metagenome]